MKESDDFSNCAFVTPHTVVTLVRSACSGMGDLVGEKVSFRVEGAELGAAEVVGISVGATVGTGVGATVGALAPSTVGAKVGLSVGGVGDCEGVFEGAAEDGELLGD